MRNTKFRRTTCINKLLQLKKTYRVVQGGTGASKTFSIISILIDRAMKSDGLLISVVSDVLPNLKKGAINDFETIMKATGRYDETRWNKSESFYTFTNGSKIEFFGMENEMKARGSRRSILYINEANRLSWKVADQLIFRTDFECWFDFNPSNKFWCHTEFVENDPDNTDFIVVNYLDNESCPQKTLNTIKKAKKLASKSNFWNNWYQVYGLGNIGRLESSVFKTLHYGSAPKEAQLLGYGMDFGYTNDVTTIVELKKWKDNIYFRLLMYETRANWRRIKDVANAKKVDFQKVTVADHDQRLIDDLRLADGDRWLIVKTDKRERNGIPAKVYFVQELERYNIFLDVVGSGELGEHLKNEWENLKYLEDKDGNIINKIFKSNDHSVDAGLYRWGYECIAKTDRF